MSRYKPVPSSKRKRREYTDWVAVARMLRDPQFAGQWYPVSGEHDYSKAKQKASDLRNGRGVTFPNGHEYDWKYVLEDDGRRRIYGRFNGKPEWDRGR